MTLSRNLSSVAFDNIDQNSASIVEVDFKPTLVVKAKNTVRDSFSKKFLNAENVTEIRGTIIVSF